MRPPAVWLLSPPEPAALAPAAMVARLDRLGDAASVAAWMLRWPGRPLGERVEALREVAAVRRRTDWTVALRLDADEVRDDAARAATFAALVSLGPAKPAWLHVPAAAVEAAPDVIADLAAALGVPWSAPLHAHESASPRAGAAAVFVSPVQPTGSKPGATSLGWEGLRREASRVGCPVIALGGLGPGDWSAVQAAGAHGVAALGGAWREDAAAWASLCARLADRASP